MKSLILIGCFVSIVVACTRFSPVVYGQPISPLPALSGQMTQAFGGNADYNVGLPLVRYDDWFGVTPTSVEIQGGCTVPIPGCEPTVFLNGITNTNCPVFAGITGEYQPAGGGLPWRWDEVTQTGTTVRELEWVKGKERYVFYALYDGGNPELFDFQAVCMYGSN